MAIPCVAALAAAGYAVLDLKMSPDSLSYALVAENLLQGRGLVTPIIYPWSHPTPQGYAPFTFQPPFYPLCLALLGGVRPGVLWPAMLWNVVGYVSIAAITFAMARRCTGPMAAVFASLIVIFSYAMWGNVHRMLSEYLFMGLFLASLLALQMSRDRDEPMGLYAASGVLAASALATKFVGLALLPVMAYEAVWILRRQGFKPAVRAFAVMAGPALIVLVALWGRNYLLEGSIRGFPSPDPERSMADAVGGFLKVSVYQLGIPNYFGNRLLLLVGMLGVPAALLGIQAVRKEYRLPVWRTGLDQLVVLFFSYLALLVVALSRSEPRVESRFVIPVVPLAVTAAVAMIYHGWQSVHRWQWTRLPGAVAVVSLVYLLTTTVLISVDRRAWNPNRWDFADGFVELSCFQWLEENAAAGSMIATNRASQLPFFGPYKTIEIPSRGWHTKYPMPQDMEDWLATRMSALGADLLVLFDSKNSRDEEKAGMFIASLSQGELVGQKFELLWSADGGSIYRLKRDI